MRREDPFNAYPGLGEMKNTYAEYEFVAETESGHDQLGDQEEPRPMPVFFAATIILAVLLGMRLVDLQVVQGAQNRVLADGNRIRSREIPPPRGEIIDSNGTVLATSEASYTLEIYPAELPRAKKDWEAVLGEVAQVTGIDMAGIKNKLLNEGLFSLNPIAVADHIDRDRALVWQVRLEDLPGINLALRPQRQYASVGDIGHIVGYVGTISPADQQRWPTLSLAASVGKSGLEYQYEPLLQGVAGQDRIEVDAKGRVDRILQEVPPTQGDTLKLYLDARLQDSLTTHLTEAAGKRSSAKAAAVVMDVHTGGILAMVSLPTFDPNVFVLQSKQADRVKLLQDSNQPLLNRAVDGAYPSGSTIKPVIATGALVENVINPQTQIDTSAGVLQIGQWRFPDWKVHGVSDVRKAIAESNDIFFYEVGGGYGQISGLGPDRMAQWMRNFGFGEATGIDLPAEASGLVPTPAWKRQKIGESWYIGDSYHMAIGQGYFLATPLQLARAIGAIANGGTLLQPQLVEAVLGPNQQELQHFNAKVITQQVADPAQLEIVREGMRETIVSGTARSLGQLSVPVAGKTGTAQFDNNKETHSWFAGYAPADNPEIAFAFIVEGGGESSDSAVPAAKAFLADWIKTRSAAAAH